MQNSITFYNTATGEITGSLITNDPKTIEANSGIPHVLGVGNAEYHYVKDGEILSRPTQLTTLTGLTLANLPTPCQIIIDGISYEVDEPTVELEFDEPGTHNIKIVAFPHLDKEFTVEA